MKVRSRFQALYFAASTLLMLMSSAPNAAMYRCVSPQGAVSFQDHRCRDASDVQRLKESPKHMNDGIAEENYARYLQMREAEHAREAAENRDRGVVVGGDSQPAVGAASRGYQENELKQRQSRALTDQLERQTRLGYSRKAARTAETLRALQSDSGGGGAERRVAQDYADQDEQQQRLQHLQNRQRDAENRANQAEQENQRLQQQLREKQFETERIQTERAFQGDFRPVQ